jgi:hypothetical protein
VGTLRFGFRACGMAKRNVPNRKSKIVKNCISSGNKKCFFSRWRTVFQMKFIIKAFLSVHDSKYLSEEQVSDGN